MRHRVLLAGAGVVLLAAGLGGGLLLREDPAHPDATASPEPTVVVERGTLRQAETLSGRVGYAGTRTVSGLGDGLITWLPSVGATVSRGAQLFRVDDAPVTVMYGDMPMYRTLAEPEAPEHTAGRGRSRPPPPAPQTGHDVDLVAQNLAALGFWHGGTTDQSYSGYLVSAVKAWQVSVGEQPTGRIRPGQIVIAPGPVRVLSAIAEVGTPEAQDVVKVTGTRRSITLEAAPELAQTLAPGARLRVRLGNGTELPTRVTHIGAAVEDDNGQSVLPVEVRALRPRLLRAAGPGAVSASLVTAERRHALHVPVNSLLALSGGGYALERSDHHLVPVTIGLIADGEVEVTGIEEGARVVVAQ